MKSDPNVAASWTAHRSFGPQECQCSGRRRRRRQGRLPWPVVEGCVTLRCLL